MFAKDFLTKGFALNKANSFKSTQLLASKRESANAAEGINDTQWLHALKYFFQRPVYRLCSL